MRLTDKYQPINCAFHDYLEHFATLRQPISLKYFLNGEETKLSNVILYDLSGGRNGEFAHLKNEELNVKIRMDHIISIENIEAKSFISNYC